MNANDLIKVIDTIELPILDQCGCVHLDAVRLKSIFGVEKKGYFEYIYNFKEGKLEEHEKYSTWEDKTRIELFNGITGDFMRKAYYTWFSYMPVYDATFVGLYSFDTSKIKGEGDRRDFVLENYYFITKDKKIVFKRNDEWIATNEKIVVRDDIPFSFAITDLGDSLTSAMLKQFGIFRTSSTYAFIRSTSALSDYLFRDYNKEIGEEKLSKKFQKFTEEVMALPLKPIEYNGGYTYKEPKIAKLEQINEDVSVIRWFVYDPKAKSCYEYMRYYATGDTNFLCDIRSDGKFHVITKNILKQEMVTDDFVMDRAELSGSVFRYFFDMIDSFDISQRAYNLYETFRFDLLEKFAKTGLGKVVGKSLKGYIRSRRLPYTTIGEIFSIKIGAKETDIYKALGLNKYQYKKLVEAINDSKHNWRGYEETEIIAALRTYLKGDAFIAINDVDNATFDTVYGYIKKICGSYYYATRNLNDCFANCHDVYSSDAKLTLLKAYAVLTKCGGGRRDGVTLLTDYVNMVCKMNDARHFPVKFRDLSDYQMVLDDVKAMHDAAQAVYNLVIAEVQKAGFEKAVKKCKKWEYANEVFSVISPTEPGDLAREGLELSHCVKSYVDKVVAGKTNIMFIRNTDNLDKPFFTVEIANDGTVEQVHGFSNRNADTEPGMEDFIKEWTKAKKMKKANFDKIR